MMKETRLLREFDFEIYPEAPLFVISVVSELVGIPVWTLRKLDEMGIVEPKRMGKKTRCYSKTQIRKLIHVNHLMNDRGVSIGSLKVVLEFSDAGQESKD